MLTLIQRCFRPSRGAILAAALIVAATPAGVSADEPQPPAGTPTLAPPPGTPATAEHNPAGGQTRRSATNSRPNKLRISSSAKTDAAHSVVRMENAQAAPVTSDSAASPPATPATPAGTPEAADTSEIPAAPARIQPHNPKPVAADVEKLVGRAYKLSQSAKDEDDYTQILTLCQQTAAATTNEPLAAYSHQLMAWAYDHRGQLVSARAASLAAEAKADEARSMEEQALADYDRAVQSDPSRWRAVHNRGVSYALLGPDSYQLALQDFDLTLQLEPRFYKAWFNRAEIRREVGRHEEAVADYTQALRLKPDDPLTYRGRGHTYYLLRQLRRALDDFVRVVQLDPENVQTRVDRADLYTEMGQWEQAARDYQQALKLEKSFGRAYLGAAWLMATCPDQRIRHPEYSVRAAEKAVELDGTQDHQYLDTLAAAYASAGMFAEAKDAAQQALKLAPDEKKPAVKNRLALYEQKQPFRQAARAVQQAGATTP